MIGEGILLSASMVRHHRVPTLKAALISAIAGEAEGQSNPKPRKGDAGTEPEGGDQEV